MLQLNHVGLAARDAAVLAELLQLITGAGVSAAEDLPDEGVRVRFVDTGHCKLELLESLNPDSPVARFIDRHGQGLHHIAFTVSDIEQHLSRLRSAGFEPVSAEPKAGAGGKRIFFLHPKTTGRILIEFCQPAYQWAVNVVGPAPDLKAALLKTGRVNIGASPSTSLIVARNALPPDSAVKACRSLVLYYPTSLADLPKLDAQRVLVCLSDTAVEHATSIQMELPKTQLAVLPATTPTEIWAALILQFWTAHE